MSHVLHGSSGPLSGQLIAYERVDGNIQQQLSCSVNSSETNTSDLFSSGAAVNHHVQLILLYILTTLYNEAM